ncbi:hypothetical protein CN151_10530 [Sinorhizobium meliloti]|uniref:hypothetical protein n=1 Tax=Rhizobium meliloti TaxID=382 RepID=UPI000FD5586D|nr:hypothetical protein [Sinorhizobium meliloti]RVL05076.1 hypothetical protein CN151_10530 [Sinorhizobium meliloti]
MTENPKTPAKKTIQDPPEYAAAGGQDGGGEAPEGPQEDLRGGQLKWNEQRSGETEAGYQQNGQSAVAPSEKESGPTGSGK